MPNVVYIYISKTDLKNKKIEIKKSQRIRGGCSVIRLPDGLGPSKTAELVMVH